MLVDNFKHYIVWGLTVNINSHLEYKSFADFGDAPPPTTASSNHCGELEEIVACTFFPTSVSPSCVKSTREVLAESFKSLQESRDYSSVILCYYSNTINNLIMSLCPWTFQLKTRRKLCTMKWKLKTNQLNKLRTQKVSHKKKNMCKSFRYFYSSNTVSRYYHTWNSLEILKRVLLSFYSCESSSVTLMTPSC